MGVFSQDGSALEWRGGHEIVRVEPWGSDSLRVRGTLWQSSGQITFTEPFGGFG